MVKIILLGNPQSTNNIYKSRSMGKFIGVYMSKQGKELKESYQWQCKSQYRKPPLTTSVSLRVQLFFGDKRNRDIDNFNKLILDALTDIVYVDDSQIQELFIQKNWDKKNPRIEIEVIEIIEPIYL